MKDLKQLLLLFSAILFLSACTMVKHSPSASFQKVKYNPHLKLAKKESESINRGDEIKLNKVAIDQQEEELAENATKTSEVQSQSIDAEKESASIRKKVTPVTAKHSDANSNISEEKATKPINFNLSPQPEAPKATVHNVLEPLAAASDDQILDLIYIILIILLVLLVVGLIIDLSGGLLGTLIAIILILLILHWLGVI